MIMEMLALSEFEYSFQFPCLSTQDCTIAVAVYSNIQKLPACQVFRIAHSDWTVDGVTLTPIGYLLESITIVHERYCPELYTHEIVSGHVLYAMVFKPHDFVPGKKYPTVLNVYGGPEVQLVSNTFKVSKCLKFWYVMTDGSFGNLL